MPRTARTTTALIASLSLMVPSFGQVALAQDAPFQALLPDAPLDGETAAALNAEQARFQPELSAALAAELAAGLTPDLLKCADGAPVPCGAEVPLVTPSGIAVELAENGTFVLLPAEVQEKAVELTGLTPAHAAEQAGLNAEEAKAAEAAAQIEADAAKATEAAAAQDAQAAEQAAAEAAKEAEAQAAAEAKAAEAKAAADAKAAEEAALAAAAQAEAETKAAEKAAEEAQKLAAEEVAKAKAEADAAAAAAPAVTPAPAAETVAAPSVEPAAPAPEAAPAESAPAASLPAVEPAPAPAPDADAKALAEALAKEGAATATTDATAVAVTPEAKAETTVDDLAKALAAEGKAIDPTMQPEAVAVETEASKAAAAAAEAPVAAALEAFGAKPTAPAVEGAAAPAVDEVKITDEARTSAQDFDTSVAEAARQAAEQLSQPTVAPAVEAKGDGGLSDFEKLAIAGLGALAVGTMLNNNRRVSLNTGDRIIVTRPDGSQEVIKDENVLLFRPGSDVRTETFDDGSTRTIVTREDGSQIVTIRDAELRVLKRVKVMADGTEYALIDETEAVTPVQVNLLPAPAPAYIPPTGSWDEAAVRAALARETAVDRTFTLNQVRNIPEVRALVAPVEIEAVTFDTGSAAIKADQARALALLGTAMQDRIAKNPREMFLIEGHTDTVGQAGMNLALSDRRAESVALALTEYFAIPPENMVVQGYGEQFLKVREAGDIRANRRAAVRRITDLLQTAANN